MCAPVISALLKYAVMLCCVVINRWKMRNKIALKYKPPHDSRECIKTVSVSYCASYDVCPDERLRISGNLLKKVVLGRSKRTHHLQVSRNGAIK